MKKPELKLTATALSAILLSGCAVGPDYKRPALEVPAAYKESSAELGWKQAEPRDYAPRGSWWAIFRDPQLDGLMAKVDVSNQGIAAAEAQLRIAAALADQARAGFWPTVTGTVQKTESQPSGTTGPIIGQAATRRTIYSLPLNASWEADLWGRIRRQVEAGEAGTLASASDLVNARLSAQAALAQDYFQLRAYDSQKAQLDATVAAYEKLLELTRNRYNAGVVSRVDIAQAETQLNSAKAQTLDLGVQRAQLEHAIAVLIGTPAPGFALAAGELAAVPPPVPAAGVPADLLERRPDVAAAERRVEAANAQIGVAKAAYFPVATLTGAYGYQTANSALWFTAASNFWSVGAALALTLIDGGRRAAVSDQAIAGYDQTVANYRGTVLTAFAEVEDNLAALRILEAEAAVQDDTVRAAQQSYDITLNQYKAGIVNFLQVAISQTALLNAQTTALTIRGRRMVASVLLVKALGGGWNPPQ
jgi:NodT family efflux transporter outer membrane factor (OMF) lipoprotein